MVHTHTTCTHMIYLSVFKYTKSLHLVWMHKCAFSRFMDVDIEHWVGGTEGSLTTWGGHMTSIFQQPRPWGQTVRHKCIINWALFHYVHCSFISMSAITRKKCHDKTTVDKNKKNDQVMSRFHIPIVYIIPVFTRATFNCDTMVGYINCCS